MNRIRWEIRVPIFKNRQICGQLGIAIGIPFGALIIFLFLIKAYNGLFFVFAALFFAFLLVLLLFRGTYDVRYELNGQGIVCQNQEKQKKRVKTLSAVTFLFGLFSKNPTAAGAGLLAGTRTESKISWKQIKKIKYSEKQKSITVHASFAESIVLFCTDGNYLEIKQQIENLRGDA